MKTTALALVLTVASVLPAFGAEDVSSWYAFKPDNDAAKPSAIGMSDWVEKPAGKHGRIVAKDGELMYNGQPIKLWGLNLCYSACSPEKATADQRAAFYPKFGINTVRFHKWIDGSGWSGIQSAESVAEFDPAGLDRLDYQVAKLKEAGVYIKLSQSFGTIKMGPADVRDVPYLAEFGKFDGKNKRVGGGNSTLFYSPEMQNLTIRQIANLLKHKNPYTGLTYAEDPAIAFVEIVNESSILFFTSMNPLKQSPTLRRTIGERFSQWLRKKYASQDGLVKAWGDKALDSFEGEGFPKVGESLDKNNVLPLGNPWFWDPTQLAGSQAFRKQRLLDSMQFLYELQNEAYDRIVAGVRAAGYKGEMIGSNWQAGRAYSHYANIHSDSRVGTIDRHNYFSAGGGRGKPLTNTSMLARAGSGMLSSGLQQVDNRPFMLSEWIHTFPGEWGVEGPAILGAYAMGLQGWDISYMFQNGDGGGFSKALGGSTWDVTAPQVVGVFPAVARAIHRGDVKPATVQAVRNVHVPSLFEGKLSFEDSVKQGYDDKELDGSAVPAQALAVARATIKFTDTFQETPKFDMAPYIKDGFIVSSTGQLKWKEGASRADGFFTMDTPGTKAVVGFAQGQKCDLGEVSISPQCRFGAIYVTARDKDQDLKSAGSAIVVAIARARNTGQEFDDQHTKMTNKGKGPVLMEPVKATIKVGRGVKAVYLLDHDGRRTDKTLAVTDGTFTIDGAADQTPYYEVVMQ